MARVDPEHLSETGATRVFMAFKLAEAQQAEAVLTNAGITYAVVPEAVGRTIFGSPRSGAVFSVEASEVGAAATRLTRAGLSSGLLVDPTD